MTRRSRTSGAGVGDSVASARGFATFLVLWTIALAAVVLVAVQSITHKQAAAGRNAVSRVRAYWAARAGIEAQLAVLAQDNLTPDENSATRVNDDLAAAGLGTLAQASYQVRYFDGDNVKDGARDEHARLNINLLSRESLALLVLDDGIADSIIDWVDSDDDTEENGAEIGSYQSQKFSYKPRNAPMRSLKELELVINVRPQDVRGEDWNLNGLLDPNEDDGDLGVPPDNADGVLDLGWSRFITAVSDDSGGPGYGLSGEPRLDLTTATSSDIAQRTGIATSQAESILTYISSGGSLGDLIDTNLSALNSQSTGAGGTLLNGQQAGNQVQDLTDEQLGKVLDETYVPDEALPRSGKLNINTVDSKTLEYLSELPVEVADAIIAERNARSGGFVRLTDLLAIPEVSREVLATLYPYVGVKSQVFTATCRGRDEATGIEVEITAVLDRSTIPVMIKDLNVK